MTFQKKLAVLGGTVVLVGAGYLGFGAATTSNTVVAEETSKEVAATTLDKTDEAVKLGYTFGAQIAMDMKRQNLADAVSVDALAQAFEDVFSGAELKMTPEEMQETQMAYQKKMEEEFAKMQQELEAMGVKNAELSAEFLAENAKTPGIVTTDSGLQYKIDREGKGKQPTANDTVKVHYTGKLIDGTKFDSSYDRGTPADFPVSGVIPGFSEGLQAMKEGAKATLFIPADQAYGPNGPPSIGPNQALIFEVELIEVVTQSDTSNKAAVE